jgi:AraC family transcriptional regulator of adaptative response/methylated-DNA-[protein]-cysteine methyltransferase
MLKYNRDLIAAKIERIEKDPRWQKLISKDSFSDGIFYYSVKTTGVYCRPSCGARAPKPENVDFYTSTTEAEKAGFRPCKRCKPDQLSLKKQQTQLITDLCRWIEQGDESPTLENLAKRAQMSPFHLHRVFKEVVGVTPKSYVFAQRKKRIQQELKEKKTKNITEAIYEAGYNSNGRFYEESKQLLGMTPKRYRSGGNQIEIRFAIGDCSLGIILVAASSIGICAILLGDDPNQLIQDLQDQFPKALLVGGDNHFEKWVAQVVGFIEDPQLGLNLPLDIRGTAFQQRVWQALRELPFGSTISYSELAKKVGVPKSIRAVAQACASNRLAVAIPCHRVVRHDGHLSGYRWGVERKQQLIQKESSR